MAILVSISVANGQHGDHEGHGEHGAKPASDSTSESAASPSKVSTYVYDPASKVDPFDTLSQSISKWLKDPRAAGIDHKDDNWQGAFCHCMENGYISSWYQYASAMYIMDKCTTDDGLTLRSGHMQLRHEEPLQAAMGCDMLKLTTYCFMHACPECLEPWDGLCDAAHYTVPLCDVNCNGVAALGGSGFAFLVAMIMVVFAMSNV